MSIPPPDVVVPPRVDLLASRAAGPGARLEPVWENAIGGVTFRVVVPGIADRFVKYGPRNDEVSVEGEAERLAWAARFTTVPRVLEFGHDATNEWLVTEALEGDNAVSPRWIGDPARAVRAIGTGLREFHDALPVDACPFRWDVPSRVENAALRGTTVPRELREAPPVDRLVVCHGDACAPNSLLDDAGRPAGHVDLGALGTGDRWADIAVAAMSTEWNYGPGWQEALVEAYGVPFDRERMDYYQALWNAT